MPAPYNIITCGKDGDASKHSAVPIHSLRRYRLGGWKETEYKEADEEHERHNIDRYAVTT